MAEDAMAVVHVTEEAREMVEGLPLNEHKDAELPALEAHNKIAVAPSTLLPNEDEDVEYKDVEYKEAILRVDEAYKKSVELTGMTHDARFNISCLKDKVKLARLDVEINRSPDLEEEKFSRLEELERDLKLKRGELDKMEKEMWDARKSLTKWRKLTLAKR